MKKSLKESFVYVISILMAATIMVGFDIVQNSSILAQIVYYISWTLLVLGLLRLWLDIYIKKNPLVVGKMTFSRTALMIILLAISVVATSAKSYAETEFCYRYLNNIALAAFVSFVVGIVTMMPFMNNDK